MNCKICAFLVLVGISCVLAGKFKQQKIDEKCGTNTACHAAAKRCLGNKDKKHHKDEGGLTHSEKLAAFNKCLDDNQQGSLKIIESECVDESPHAGGRARRSHHGKCKKEILDLLTITLEESVAAPIRCCFATAIKSDKVKADGSINLEHFKQKLNELITDQDVSGIYRTAFDTCLPKGNKCDVYGFKECVIHKCIDDVQALGTA
ncbi:UNVERIFIED_CONTAM: hypothetical protein RMT77_001451 [Armadillidium vulgare]